MTRRIDCNPDFEPVEIGTDVRVLRETEKAILCKWDGDNEECWFPKSMIHDDSEVYEKGTSGKLVVYRTIAEQKGIL